MITNTQFRFALLAGVALAMQLPQLAAAGSLAPEAAEPAVEAPAEAVAPVAARAPLSGLWVGGSVGMGSVNYDLVGDGAIGPDIGLPLPPLTWDFDLPDAGGMGPFYAIEIGHDWALSGAWHLAMQLDYERGNVVNEAGLSLASIPPGADAGIDYELNRESAISGLARLGYAAADGVLLYGLAGMTRANFTGSYELYYDDGVDDSGSFGDDYDFSANGVTLGIGTEVAVSDRSSIKMEYRRTDFAEYELIDTPIGIDGYFHSGIEMQSQSFRVTWAHRF